MTAEVDLARECLRYAKRRARHGRRRPVNVILEASARILESEGLRGFNTNSAAAKAGVSVGSLYQYFPNKDAILLALIERFEDAAQEAINEALRSARGRPLNPSLRLFVHALVGMHYSRPRLNRLLEAEEDRLGGGSADSLSVRAYVTYYRNTKTKSRCPSLARPNASPWRLCVLSSIRVWRRAQANDRSSRTLCAL